MLYPVWNRHTLNPNQNLANSVSKKNNKKKLDTLQVYVSVPGGLPSKFTSRKAIDMEQIMWCKCQNLLVYKSCTTVKMFNELHKKVY